MASLSNRPDGTREIYIVLASKRSKIQLGRISKKDAQAIRTKIDHIVSRKLSRLSLDSDVAQWIGGLDNNDRLFQRLVSLGLVEPRPDVVKSEPVQPEVKTLQSIVDRFTEFKRPMIAESSLNKLVQCLDVLVKRFGKDRDISNITLGEASEFESWGRKRGFSEAHQRTHNRYAKQLFAYAVDHGWIELNPFRKLKSTALAAATRHYVSPEDTRALLDACPSLQWKLLIGLARYGGLRVPSEAFALTWGMVDWDNKALSIPSKKTLRYGKSRVCPIIPGLMLLLKQGYDQGQDGSSTILKLSVGNVRRKFPDIIKKAKVEPWEDIFQALRRSCETHLVSLGLPEHAVSTWLGHSHQVSRDHYLMVTSDTFARATETTTDTSQRLKTQSTKSGAESGAVQSRNDSQEVEKGVSAKSSEESENDASPGDFQGLQVFATNCGAPRKQPKYVKFSVCECMKSQGNEHVGDFGCSRRFRFTTPKATHLLKMEQHFP